MTPASQSLLEIAESLGLDPATATPAMIAVAQARAIGDGDRLRELLAEHPELREDSDDALIGFMGLKTSDASPEDLDPSQAPAPRVPKGRLKLPEDTKGHYVVLWAPVPPTKSQRPDYAEVDVIAATGPDQAKRLAIGALKVTAYAAPFAAFLVAQAREGGILLRAVPAMHWPTDPDEAHGVKATTYTRPEPVLTVG